MYQHLYIYMYTHVCTWRRDVQYIIRQCACRYNISKVREKDTDQRFVVVFFFVEVSYMFQKRTWNTLRTESNLMENNYHYTCV